MTTTSAVLSAPLARPSASASPTIARRRLRLGITAVGMSVVLSVAWLLLLVVAVPDAAAAWRVVPGPLGVPLTAAGGALLFAMLHAALALPLEHAGGRRAVRQVPALGAWSAAWLRGVSVLIPASTVGVAATAVGGASGGAVVAAMVTLAFSVGLLALQGPLAGVVAPIRARRLAPDEQDDVRAAGLDPAYVRIVAVDDEAFVGGWIGVGPWRRLWIPEAWCAAPSAPVLRVQLRRRRVQLTSRARQRGWWRAAAWPAVGVLVAGALVPWGWQDARLWWALPALATLWAFLGVLVLPAVSRPAVFAADLLVARELGAAAVAQAITRLDAWQDDERERTPLVEFVFHPVPAAGRRVQALASARPHPLGGGHQQARLALLAGTASGSVLGRMVHCNVGRPSLWVVYPGD